MPHDAHVMENAYGATMRWTSMPIEFRMDPANEIDLGEAGVVSAAVSAASQWSGVTDAGIEMRFRGTAAGLTDGYDDQSVVVFRHEWTAAPELLAVTQAWSNEEGEILDFDLVVNTRDHDWSLDGSEGQADLWNTLAHEFGHTLGIGHIDETREATMFPTAPAGEIDKRDLSGTDEAVAAYLYPPLAADDAEALAAGCASAAAPIGPWFLLALLFLRRME